MDATAGNAHEGTITIGHDSLTSLTSGANNLAVGYLAGAATTTGGQNIAIGRQSLETNVTGASNIAIGYLAMNDVDAGNNSNDSDHNIFIGLAAGGGAWHDTKSEFNVGIGNYVMDAVLTGAVRNTAVGYNALSANTTARDQVAIGWSAGDALTTGEANVSIGSGALTTATTALNSVAIGINAMGAVQAGQAINGCVAIGHDALYGGSTTTAANYSVAIGSQALKAITSGAGNIGIGLLSGGAITDGHYNLAVGLETMKANVSADYCVAIGREGQRDNVSGDQNTSVGTNALAELTTGNDNVAIGMQAMKKVDSGTRNIAIGTDAFDAADGSESDNIAIGYDAMGDVNYEGTVRNVVIGSYAGDGMGTAAANSDNVLIGYDSGGGTWSSAAVTDNVVVGKAAFSGANVGGCQNIAIGTESLAGSMTAAADNNTAIGHQAGNSLTSGAQNILIGAGVATALTTGENNVFLGKSAGATITDSSNNILIGESAGNAIAAGQTGTNGTIAIGYNALTALTSGDGNVAIGFTSGAALTDGQYNTLLGYEAGLALDGGTSNVFVGWKAGRSQDEANHCIAIGHIALINSTNNSSHNNIAIGSNSLDAIADLVAIDNVAIGFNSWTALTSGDDNIMIGSNAGDTITTGSSNTLIGNDADVSSLGVQNQIVIGAGATSPVGNNIATIGNADVTAVYMSSDGGASVSCGTLGIGLGTTSPSVPLHLSSGISGTSGLGATYVRIATTTNSGRNLHINLTDDSYWVVDSGTYGIKLNTGTANEGVNIDGSGQVGIGGIPSGGYLHVHGDMDNTGSYGIKVEAAGSDGSSVGYMMAFIDENDDVVGSVTTSSSGNSTAYNTSSDYRLKENEVSISDGISRINRLKPYRFNWKKNADKTVDGFFAHEVSGIVPEAITGEKDAVSEDVLYAEGDSMPEGKEVGDVKTASEPIYQGIDQSKLVPLLVAAVQELSAKVEEVEAKLK